MIMKNDCYPKLEHFIRALKPPQYLQISQCMLCSVAFVVSNSLRPHGL